MTKLKTLKNLIPHINFEEEKNILIKAFEEGKINFRPLPIIAENKIDVNDLKAEAVKWVKYARGKGSPFIDFANAFDAEFWIIKFFNLTEEDLK